jgi:hypothetical protein
MPQQMTSGEATAEGLCCTQDHSQPTCVKKIQVVWTGEKTINTPTSLKRPMNDMETAAPNIQQAHTTLILDFFLQFVKRTNSLKGHP